MKKSIRFSLLDHTFHQLKNIPFVISDHVLHFLSIRFKLNPAVWHLTTSQITSITCYIVKVSLGYRGGLL